MILNANPALRPIAARLAAPGELFVQPTAYVLD